MDIPKPKAFFEPIETKTGEWCVRLSLPGGREPVIDGFKSEAERESGSKRIRWRGSIDMRAADMSKASKRPRDLNQWAKDELGLNGGL